MASGETDVFEEVSDEHLAWMLQAMEMVCAHIYVSVLILMCRRRKLLRLVRCPSAASSYGMVRQLQEPVTAQMNSETYFCVSLRRLHPLTPAMTPGHPSCRARGNRRNSCRPYANASRFTREWGIPSRRHDTLRHCRTLYHVCFRTPPDGYQTSILRLRERTVWGMWQRPRGQQEVY
jgi:hypothetical protein